MGRSDQQYISPFWFAVGMTVMFAVVVTLAPLLNHVGPLPRSTVALELAGGVIIFLFAYIVMAHKMGDLRHERKIRSAEREIKTGSRSHGRAVRTLSRYLRTARTPELRRQAARALGGASSNEAVEALIAATRDEDHGVECQALEALGRCGNSLANPSLVAFLDDDDGERRHAAADSLVKLRWLPVSARHKAVLYISERKHSRAAELGPDAIEPLATALRNGDELAADALGQFNDPRAVSALVAGFRTQKGQRTRGKILEALGKSGNPAAVEPLSAIASDKDWTGDAVRALISLDQDECWAVISKCMQSDDSHIRQHTADALRLAKEGRAVPLLIEMLEREQNEDAGWTIAEALAERGSRGNTEALDAMRAVLESGSSTGVRARVGSALGGIQSTAAHEALLSAVSRCQAGEEALKARLIGSLRAWKGVHVLLTELLNDPHPEIQRAAIETLGRIGDERAGAALRELIVRNKGDQPLHGVAIAALKRIGGPKVDRFMAALNASQERNQQLQHALLELLEKHSGLDETNDPYLARKSRAREVAERLNSFRNEDGQRALEAIAADAKRTGLEIREAGGKEMMVRILEDLKLEGVYAGALEKYWEGVWN